MDSKWFRRFVQATPHSDVSLFCFPHAGGAASTFLPFARRLAQEMDVLAVQYPGRQDRRLEPPVEAVPRLADLIAESMLPQLRGPYALFGHSMGAVLAYETARALRTMGAPLPRRVFLSGRGAPRRQANPHDVMISDAGILTAIRRLGGTGAGVLDDPELVAMAMPALRADYRALATYTWTPGLPVDCPVSVLLGEADPVVASEDTRDWRHHFDGEFTFHGFPGGHFYLDEQVDAVCDVVAYGMGVAAAA